MEFPGAPKPCKRIEYGRTKEQEEAGDAVSRGSGRRCRNTAAPYTDHRHARRAGEQSTGPLPYDTGPSVHAVSWHPKLSIAAQTVRPAAVSSGRRIDHAERDR